MEISATVNFISYFLFPLLIVLSIIMMIRKVGGMAAVSNNIFKAGSAYVKLCQDKLEYPFWFIQLFAQIIMSFVFFMKSWFTPEVIVFIAAYIGVTFITMGLFISKRKASQRIAAAIHGGNITVCPYCGSEKATSLDEVCPSCRKKLK